jgi:predicted transposase YdaD
MRLEQLSTEEKISAFSKKALFDMTERVIVNLAKQYEKILEGVGQIMTGTVLDFEAKRIRDKGREEGWIEGREEGREEGRIEGREKGLEEGEDRMAALVKGLASQGRYEDLQKAATDKEARRLLFVEFGLN